MLPSQATELKQQAIIEKAQDPNSSVSPQAAREVLVEEANRAGVAAYRLDPNASKEARVEQMKAAIPQELKDAKEKLQPHATAIASDVDTGAPKVDLPPPTKAGVITAPDEGEVEEVEEDEEDSKWWKVVGGRPQFGDGTKEVDFTQNLSDQTTWLEGRLQDKFFGDWYFNAGVIIFACLSSWVIAVVGGGIGWVLLVMATCSTYYRTSIRRVRRNARDDIRREMAKARLETDHETLEWINSFLVKFWPIYSRVLAKSIVQSVDQVLSIATPPMIESLKMTEFLLGTKPPRLEHVKTYPKSEDDIVLMDWKFSFNPNDTADMTARQLKVKQNPKVVLEVRLGKGLISKALHVIVEDMACEGLMRVKVKLQLEFPHIDRVEICFLEKPTFDYVCKPLGGETFGFDINFIPGLEHFIQEQIHANLAPMMYSPNVFPIEVAKMLAGTAVDQAIGVVQITFHGAQGLKNPDQFAGTPDPYATVSINNRDVLGKTKTVKESANPRWSETINIVVTSFNDTLNVHVYDYNEYRKDRELGEANFALERFQELDEFENEQLELILNNKPRGLVQADLRFFPVLKQTKLEDGTVQPPPETTTGIARYTVEQAKELDGTKSMIGLLNPYAVLLLNNAEKHITEKLKRTNNPIWSKNHVDLLITDRKTARVGLQIKDDRELSTDPVIGSYQIKLDDLLELNARGQSEFNLAGVKTGKVRLKLEWRPVDIKGGLGGPGGYITPIGVMRVYFKNARDLRNVETLGKSDPYVRVLLSGVQKARTVTWQNNLNPDFDEVVYVPVHSIREKLLIEVMDEENMAKDRSLGHLEVSLKDYITQSESGEYEVNDSKQMVPGALIWGPGRSNKGTLNYSCSFFPCIPTVDPEEEEREKNLETGSLRTSTEVPRTSTDSLQTGATPSKNGEVTPKKSLEKSPLLTEAGRDRSATQSSVNSQASKKKALPQVPEVSKIRITADNVADYESGLVVFTLIDGDIARPSCYLEVLMDDMVFPSYSSNKIKTRHHEFNETGDAIVRELDMSKITLRLMEHVDREGKGSENHIIAKLSGPTLSILQRSLYTPTQLTLKDDKTGTESKVTINLKFIPIKMKLDASESFRNMGNLKVDVISASNLPSMDRNGFSDPYCKFKLNGLKVHETEKKKKTLNPVWNESFTVSIRSRTASQLKVELWDWDFGDSDDRLGDVVVDLNTLEPFTRKEVDLPLDGKSGTLKLALIFTPDYITRSRQGDSTFHGTLTGMSKVTSAPVKVIGIAAGGVEHGVGAVGHGVGAVGGGITKSAGSFLGKGFRRRKSRTGADLAEDDGEHVGNGTGISGGGADTPPVPVLPSIEVPEAGGGHQRTVSGSTNRLSFSNGNLGGAETGTGNISVVSASGFPPKANVRVHVVHEASSRGPKEIHKTKAVKSPSSDVRFESESIKVPCAADAPFKLIIKDHSTFGHSEELGEGHFYLSDQGPGGEQTVQMTKGEGKVVVRSAFVPFDASSVAGSTSGKSGKLSRFGMNKRDSRERSATPGA